MSVCHTRPWTDAFQSSMHVKGSVFNWFLTCNVWRISSIKHQRERHQYCLTATMVTWPKLFISHSENVTGVFNKYDVNYTITFQLHISSSIQLSTLYRRLLKICSSFWQRSNAPVIKLFVVWLKLESRVVYFVCSIVLYQVGRSHLYQVPQQATSIVSVCVYCCYASQQGSQPWIRANGETSHRMTDRHCTTYLFCLA